MAQTCETLDRCWQDPMQEHAKTHGYFKALGEEYYAFYTEEGPQLLVLFENAANLRHCPDHLPSPWAIAKAQGWSVLTLIAPEGAFWRSAVLADFFDELDESCFFDDFDQLLFHGNEAEAYAAAAYSASAPGARLVLVSPRASFDPAHVAWDRRYALTEGESPTPRYDYAPKMVEAAREVWLLYNPAQDFDARHAELFKGDWVQSFSLRHTGKNAYAYLYSSGALGPILEAAMRGELSRQNLAQAWRARRKTPNYLRFLLESAIAAENELRQYGICSTVSRALSLPRFNRRLRQLRQSPLIAARIAQQKGVKSA